MCHEKKLSLPSTFGSGTSAVKRYQGQDVSCVIIRSPRGVNFFLSFTSTEGNIQVHPWYSCWDHAETNAITTPLRPTPVAYKKLNLEMRRC